MRWWALAPLVVACACHSRPAPERAPEARGSNAAPASSVAAEPVSLPVAGRPSAVAARPDAAVLRVSAGDLVVERPGSATPLFSYAAWARATFERDLAELAEGDAGVPLTIREIDVTPVSWVGSLLAVKERTFTTQPDHEAHPAGGSRLLTLEVSDKGPSHARLLTLRDLFDEATLFRELRRDPRVKRALRGAGKPEDLDELVRVLGDAEPEYPTGCYGFPPDLLGRFAFDHLVGPHLAVHLGLSGTGACRDAFEELELFLTPPASLKASLVAARDGHTGFFAIDKPAGLTDVHLRMTSSERTPVPRPPSSDR
jgi:hypothetical protein